MLTIHNHPGTRRPVQSGRLLRPATLDLILTKMMRGADPEDLSDIAFLLRHEPLTDAELRAAFERVRMPDIPELRDAFRAAQPKVLAMAKPQAQPPSI